MSKELSEIFQKASEMLSSFPKSTKIRVISHYDADGTTSAAIICKALYRAGYDFQASLMRNPFDKGLARVSKEKNELIIFSDMGSGQIETIEKMDCKAIIIDHHQALKENVSQKIIQINANLFGINGNYEACGATLSYAFAKAVDSKNKDLVYLAVAGATGDKQYINGFRGFNKDIIEEGVKNGFLKEKVGLKLTGESLFDALFYSIDPFYSEISGNKEGISELFKKLNIDENVKLDDLDPEKIKQLHSYLMLKLIKKGCEKNILDTVIRKRYWSDELGSELERFADLVDSCGKGGNRGLGLEICMGNKDSFEEAEKLEAEYKGKILDELIRLEKEGFKEKKRFRYFYSIDSSLGGVIGGIATNFILDTKKPLLSLVRKDNEIHVSCRGNQFLVSKGLDLGQAMNKAAKKLNGHGGGHKIAAGATIDLEKEEIFLDTVNELIDSQFEE